MNNPFAPPTANRWPPAAAGRANGSGDLDGSSASATEGQGESYVRSHAKALSAGSVTHRSPLVLVALSAVAIACAWMLAVVPGANASLNLVDRWGSPDCTSSSLAGRFAVDNCTPGGQVGPTGLAVNDTSGDVYVTDPGNNRIQQFSGDGAFVRAWGINASSANASEMQGLMVNATGGKFTLSFGAETTGELAFNAPPSGGVGPTASVQNALAALPSIGAGNVRAYGGPGNGGGSSPYVVRFAGALAGIDVATQITGASAGGDPLTGGAGAGANSVTATTHVPGGAVTGSFEICEAAAGCIAAGSGASAGGMSAPRGVAVNQVSGDVYVVDEGHKRIDQFTADGVWLRSWGGDVIDSGPHANGTDFEICTAVDVCKTGASVTAGGAFRSAGLQGLFRTQPAVVPSGPPNAGNVLVPDAGNGRVQEFTAAGAFVRAFGWDVVQTGGAGDDNVAPINEFEICTVVTSCKDGTRGGTAPGQFSQRNPQRVSVDSSGAIYVVDAPAEGGSPSFRVQKFTPQVGPPTLSPAVFAPDVLTASTAEAGPTGITVDPVDDHVFVAKGFQAGQGTPPATVAENRVLELDAAGNLLDIHMSDIGLNPTLNTRYPRSGYAIRAGGGPLYLTATAGVGAPSVFALGDALDPTITLNGVTDVTAESATLDASINPNGGLETSYRIEYSLNGRKWTPLTAPTAIGNGESDVSISQMMSGLPPNLDVLLRIVATKDFNSARAVSDELEFRTLGRSPQVQTGIAWWNGPSELALSATVDPRNANTTYYFEYGPTDSYGDSVPLNRKGPAGLQGTPRRVVQQLFDLDTETAYHYRVVAVNEFGASFGTDRVVAPHSLSQVYELVSDGESNGLGVAEILAVSDDGRRVAIEAQTLGDPAALSSQSNYFVAQLGADRWRVPRLGLDPELGPESTIPQSPRFATDLGSRTLAQRTTIEGHGQEAVWVRTKIDGTYEFVSPRLFPLEYAPPLSGNQFARFAIDAGSADLSAFAFKKAQDFGGAVTYLPGEPLVTKGYVSGIAVNIYQVSNAGPSAQLSLVNIGPSGDPLSNVCGAWVGLSDENDHSGDARDRYAMSSDGAVVYFSARPTAPTTGSCAKNSHPLRIYKRIDDSSTVEVSASTCDREAPACSNTGGDVLFQGASSDGEKVFFTSTRQLTDSDLDEPSSSDCGTASVVGCDLYLYDSDPPVGKPNLVQVSAGEETDAHPTIGSGANVKGVVESSTDGSRVYFVAEGQLTEEATEGGAVNNLYVYERGEEHPDGRIEFVTTLGSGDSSNWEGLGRSASALPYHGLDDAGEGDGHLLFFRSFAKLSDEDKDSAADLYRFDDDAEDGLACLSCEGDGSSNVSISLGLDGSPHALQAKRYASEDGTSAVFATQEAILPEDTNSVADVYVWSEGEGLNLVSGATGEDGIFDEPFMAPDGTKVFFNTKTALHPSDQNTAADVYAAGVGGGLPVPRPGASRCEDGQSCRGEAPAPTPAEEPASESFNGPGNVKDQPGRCGKAQVRRSNRCVAKRALANRACAKRKGKAKRRCVSNRVKRLSREQARQQRANNDRGGKR